MKRHIQDDETVADFAHFGIIRPLPLGSGVQEAVVRRHVYVAVHIFRCGDGDVHGIQIGGAVIFRFALIADGFRIQLHPADSAAAVFLCGGEAVDPSGVVLGLAAVGHGVKGLITGVVGHPHHTRRTDLQLGQIDGDAGGLSRFRLLQGGGGQDLRAGSIEDLYHGNVLIVLSRHRQIAGAQILGQGGDRGRGIVYRHRGGQDGAFAQLALLHQGDDVRAGQITGRLVEFRYGGDVHGDDVSLLHAQRRDLSVHGVSTDCVHPHLAVGVVVGAACLRGHIAGVQHVAVLIGDYRSQSGGVPD